MKILFPQTRYQGSKLKLIDWLQSIFCKIEFNNVLDAFGGTGAVSYLFKIMKKEVTYNDLLISNWFIGKALIENTSVKFELSKVKSLFVKRSGYNYRTVIEDQFHDIYYTDEENRLLDIAVQNIFSLKNQFEKAICLFALFQACIQKRPFNLFHRKNLYLRLTNVERSFGNKKTWDTPFPELVMRAISECNQAVFSNNRINKSINYSILNVPLPEDGFDLVYMDPPYISFKGVGVDYRDFYHFLEGICHYENWEELIDQKSKHKRLKTIPNKWSSPKQNLQEFEKVIRKFQDSKLAISYRNPGIPSISALKEILLSYKSEVIIKNVDYKYALTSSNKNVKEVLMLTD